MNNQSEEELRGNILAQLKHAYYNAKTDTVALENGVVPNHNHALVVLNNKADDIMQLITQHTEQKVKYVLQNVLNEYANQYQKHITDMDINKTETPFTIFHKIINDQLKEKTNGRQP